MCEVREMVESEIKQDFNEGLEVGVGFWNVA